MPDVDPGDVIRVAVKMLQDSESMVNVYHFQHTGAIAQTDGDVHAAMQTYIQNAYDGIEPIISEDVIQDSMDTYNVTQDRPMFSAAWPGTFQGDDTSGPLPLQNAYLLTFTTATKNSLGKKFVPGMTENQSAGSGILVGAAIAELVQFGIDLLAGFTVNAQTFKPGNYRSDTATFILWLAAIVETLSSTQRRRKPGVGA
ncbi:MAG: hypothetical protein KAT00_02570 [Planctomycetes bacterium]|nr:hypothetical protein [Planctomycetota bacterium]